MLSIIALAYWLSTAGIALGAEGQQPAVQPAPPVMTITSDGAKTLGAPGAPGVTHSVSGKPTPGLAVPDAPAASSGPVAVTSEELGNQPEYVEEVFMTSSWLGKVLACVAALLVVLRGTAEALLRGAKRAGDNKLGRALQVAGKAVGAVGIGTPKHILELFHQKKLNESAKVAPKV